MRRGDNVSDKRDKLIELINSDETLKKSFNKVYTDEPIIMTASKMKSYTPPEISEMIKLSKTPDARFRPMNWLFYRQGKFMESFTDSFDFSGDLICYFPTYSVFSVSQLRGYFSWRTKVRNEDYADAPLSFIFMYIYELLCNIGVSSEEKGFEKLIAVREHYSDVYPNIRHKLKTWLPDYAVYYNLDKSYLERVYNVASDRAAETLLEYEKYSDNDIGEAVITLSSYNAERSLLYKNYPEDMKKVIAGVFRRLCEHHAKKSKKSYPESLFGTVDEYDYNMFSSAIFYDHRKYDDFEYELSSICRFSCKNGRWRCRKYYSASSCCQKLGELVRAIDCFMRAKYEFGKPIKHEISTKYVITIIEEEIDKLVLLKKKAEERLVRIDVSKLSGIRAAADITRDRLMTESEMAEETVSELSDVTEAMHLPVSAKEPDGVQTEGNDCGDVCGLDENEYLFLHGLLYGGDIAACVKKCGVPLSVLCDGINEKLFDMFGDTVIDFDGDTPVPIEDYIDELKGIIIE